MAFTKSWYKTGAASTRAPFFRPINIRRTNTISALTKNKKYSATVKVTHFFIKPWLLFKAKNGLASSRMQAKPLKDNLIKKYTSATTQAVITILHKIKPKPIAPVFQISAVNIPAAISPINVIVPVINPKSMLVNK